MLGLPTNASMNDLRQLIHSKLLNVERELQNAQAVIQEVKSSKEIKLHLSLAGVFENTEIVVLSAMVEELARKLPT